MSQWKSIETNKPSDLVDKNGVEILLGDTVSYRRKVKLKRVFNRRTRLFETVNGHYKMVSAKVVGFGKIVKLNNRGQPIQIEYIHLKETGKFNVFRVYRSVNLERTNV